MFGLPILEVAIGVVFVYILLSVVCSALGEMVARFSQLRSRSLWKGIRCLLDDRTGTGDAKRLYEHALIKPLSRSLGWRSMKPSWISARTFSRALLDIVAPDDGGTAADLKTRLAEIKNPAVRQALRSMIGGAEATITKVRGEVEKWFDEVMDEVSAWYRRKIKIAILIWAAIVAVALNVDTFMIANVISQDSVLRTSLVAAAEEMVREPMDSTATLTQRIQDIRAQAATLGIPIGWSSDTTDVRCQPDSPSGWLVKAGGLLISTLAVSLGAPFWFSLLQKLLQYRRGGTQTAKKPEDDEDEDEAKG